MIVQRKAYLDELLSFKDSEFIKAITGIRRSGKSSLLLMYRDYLRSIKVPEEQIIYINFEALESYKLLTEETLSQYLVEHSSKDVKMYYLFDEIQFVQGWEAVINGLRVSFDSDITVTGSNAQLLAGEYATLLTGRFVSIEVYPLSFKEFLDFKQIETNDTRKIIEMFMEYRQYGGFPAVVLADQRLKDTILSGIFDSILLNDVGQHHAVKDVTTLQAISRFLMFNVGQIISVNKISNTLTSAGFKVSVPTVARYLDSLKDSFLFYIASRYDIRGKEYLKNKPKYFVADTGLRNIALGKFGENRGSELENIVYIELKRRGYKVDVGQLVNDTEVDFIARKGNEILYVQVTQQIPETSDRETDNLIMLPGQYQKLLITGVSASPYTIEGVPVISVYDWLLQN
ncbi:MAG: ATP-binding protein [Lactobacillaceae bacterium]|jgi:predicted AAA+ superfamily ATPase|nr:ATP-binding protein [Lactobacillaceae bacterium]